LVGFVHGRRDSGGMQRWTIKAVTVEMKGVGTLGAMVSPYRSWHG
jgi:hypothetical protein